MVAASAHNCLSVGRSADPGQIGRSETASINHGFAKWRWEGRGGERGEKGTPLFNAILEGQNEKNLVLEHRQPRNTIYQRFLLGWAVTRVRGFANDVLRVPIACQGSKEAAGQLSNSGGQNWF